MKMQQDGWFMCVALLVPFAALAAPVSLDATRARLEDELTRMAAPGLTFSQRDARARQLARRCATEVGKAREPQSLRGIEPGDPVAPLAARLQALCAIVDYAVGAKTDGDVRRSDAYHRDPQVVSRSGVPDASLRLGMQLEGARAASFDPIPEPVLFDIDIDRPVPRLERIPPTAPGSYEHRIVETANVALRDRGKGIHDLELVPGLYRLAAGDWSRAFLVPADPADVGPRTRVRLSEGVAGDFAFEATEHDSGHISPPGVDHTQPPPPSVMGMSADIAGVSAIVSAGIAVTGLTLYGVGYAQAEEVGLGAPKRAEAIERKQTGRAMAISGGILSVVFGSAWAILDHIDTHSASEER